VFPESYEARGFAPRRARRRDRPDPRFGWSRLSRGKKPRRAPTRRPHPGQGGGRRANGLSGRARLRSGRAGRLPASPTFSSGERLRSTRFGAHDDLSQRQRGTVVPAPQSGEPSGAPWQRVGSAGKAPRKLELVAPAAVEREPTRKQRPARAGTAPREGKALKGVSSGRERHETRPRSVGAPRKPACSARDTCDP